MNTKATTTESENESENHNSNRPVAGAATGRQKMPLAGSGRGAGGNESEKFYGYFKRAKLSRAELIGQFVGNGILLTARQARLPIDAIAPDRPDGEASGGNEGGEDTGRESNPVLESLLLAIADEIRLFADGMRKSIMSLFSYRATLARAQLKGPELVAALRMAKDERAAALAVIQLFVSIELVTRRQAAIEKFGTSRLESNKKKARLLQPRRD